MKKNYMSNKIPNIVLILLFVFQLQAQTITVNSLAELLPYLDDDNVDVKLAPGTYDITPEDITVGTFSNPLMLFEGSNNIYDFEGSIINISTEVLQSFGNVDVNEICRKNIARTNSG